MNNEQHEYHKEVGLNDYEKFFFKKVFGTNMKRLLAFRKEISKRQKWNYYNNPWTYEWFSVKGGKWLTIRLNRKKVDAYIKLIQNGDNA